MTKGSDDGSENTFTGNDQSSTGSHRDIDVFQRHARAAERRGENAAYMANRVFLDIEAIRSGVEADTQIARDILQETKWASLESNGHLSDISSALKDGLPAVVDGISSLKSTAEQIAGVPSSYSTIGELLSSRPSLEPELIILALGRGLKPEYAQQLFDSLPQWKKDVLATGLAFEEDPEKRDAAMEHKLSPGQKTFLVSLRAAKRSSIVTFKSIRALSSGHFLETKLHARLSKVVGAARTGLTGVVDGVNSLEAQGRAGISQRNTLIDESRLGNRLLHANLLTSAGIFRDTHQLVEIEGQNLHINTQHLHATRRGVVGIETLVDMGRDEARDRKVGLDISAASLREHIMSRSVAEAALAEGRESRIANQISAEQLFNIRRRQEALIHLAEQQEGYSYRAEGQRDRQIELQENANQSAELLTYFARRGDQSLLEISEGMYHLAENSDASLDYFGSIDGNIERVAQGVEDIDEKMGDLVGIAGHMAIGIDDIAGYTRDLVQVAIAEGAIRREQHHHTNILLGETIDNLDRGNFIAARTREEIAQMHISIIQGHELAHERDLVKIALLQSNNDLLASIWAEVSAQGAGIQNSIENLEHGNQVRHVTQNQARAEERFREGLGNYGIDEFDDAIELFTMSIDFWRNDHRVYFYRALCYALTNRPNDAEKDYLNALKWAKVINNPKITAIINMNLAKLYYDESKVYAQSEDSDLSNENMLKAVLAAKQACIAVPDFHKASFALAKYLAAYGLYDEARITLLKILPKDPSLIEEMLQTDDLSPILPQLKNVISASKDTNNEVGAHTLTIAAIKDCMEIEDFSTAIYCVEELMKGDALQLLGLHIWEIEEIKPIRKQIISIINKTMDQIDGNNKSQNLYAIAMLGVLCRESNSEIPDSRIFEIFLKGTENDIDILAKNKLAMLAKLKGMSEAAAGIILSINRLHRRGLAWLD